MWACTHTSACIASLRTVSVRFGTPIGTHASVPPSSPTKQASSLASTVFSKPQRRLEPQGQHLGVGSPKPASSLARSWRRPALGSPYTVRTHVYGTIDKGNIQTFSLKRLLIETQALSRCTGNLVSREAAARRSHSILASLLPYHGIWYGSNSTAMMSAAQISSCLLLILIN